MLSYLNKLVKEQFILVIAVLLTFFIYFKFLFFGHISWDDPEMVFKNDFVKEFDLKALFKNHFVGNYIPVTMLFHSIAWFLFETNDGGHHLINILLHIVNGILVYQIGKTLVNRQIVANFAALIFLLHPLQIESVAWIGELKNVLSTSFYLLAVIFYLQFNEDKQMKNYLISFLFFLLGCLSKSSVVMLPLCLFCFDIILKQKFSLRFLYNKIPFFVFSILFGLINIKTQTADLFINHAHEFPYVQRVGFAGYALIKYIFLFLFPCNLSVIYPYPEVKTLIFSLGFSVLVIFLSFLLFSFKRKKYAQASVGLFIFFNLILVLQIIPFGEVLYADRYLYIPIIGFGWLLGLLILKIKINPQLVAISLMVILTLVSFGRTGSWKSAITLYEDILKKYPEQFVALNSAGVECMFLNQDDKALEYFNKAVRIAPNNYKGFYNRGLLYLKNNKPELAVKSFNQTLALHHYTKAYAARASAYYAMGDMLKAMNDANFTLSMDAGNSKAHFVLGNCYNDLNKINEAISEYNKCIELNQREADFYFKRAIAFGKLQNFKDCLSDLTVCLELNPAYYEGYYWRGVAKVNLKQNACDDFKTAAQQNIEPAVKAFNAYCR